MNLPVYFDHASTTPLKPEVLEAMMPYLTENYGNASSRHHAYGWLAEQAVEAAKAAIKASFQAKSSQLIFTSGATEAINTVILGFVKKHPDGHIISLKTEHKATLACLDYLEGKSIRVTHLEVDKNGSFEIQDLAIALSMVKCPVLFTVLWANNETGIMHPISEIAKLKAKHSFEIHVDASQAVGKIPIFFDNLNIDYLTYSSHKIYGPKGIGAILSKTRVEKMVFGGGQQSEQRAGTLNTPAIVGMAAATQLAFDHMEAFVIHTKTLQTTLEDGLSSHGDIFYIHGNTSSRVSNISSIAIKNTDSEAIIQQIAHKFAITNGSACNAASTLPSHVLKAMGFSDTEAYSTIRLSFGWSNTSQQIDDFIKAIRTIVF